MGRFNPDLVAVEARRLTQQDLTQVPVALPATAPQAALTDHRPAPSLAAYDTLLIRAGA